jgi:hypothetical protein
MERRSRRKNKQLGNANMAVDGCYFKQSCLKNQFRGVLVDMIGNPRVSLNLREIKSIENTKIYMQMKSAY